MKGKQEVQDNQIKQKYNTLFSDEDWKACYETRWEVLVKRNKFWTFLNLLICILCFYCLLFLLDWGDIDMLVPPFEDIKETFLMYFLLIALTILSIVFSLQLTKKWQIIINEYWIIDKYSIFSKWDIYLWKDIRWIYYSWRWYRWFMKAIVLSLKSGKKSFVLPTLTRIWMDVWKIWDKIVYYCNIHQNDEVFFSDFYNHRFNPYKKVHSYKKIYNLDEWKRKAAQQQKEI